MAQVSTPAQRLNQIMSEQNLKQVELLEKTIPFQKQLDIKLGKSALSQYVNGKSIPAQKQLYLLSLTLNVSEAWLMGYDVPMERNDNKITTNTNKGVVMGSGDNNGTMNVTNNDMDTADVEHGQKKALKSSDALLRVQEDGGDVRTEILTTLQRMEKTQKQILQVVEHFKASPETRIENVSDFITVEEELYPYHVYERLSAGIGSAVWDDGSFDTVYFDKELPHDIASWIVGDSMEPTFLNGEVALIRANGYDYDGAVYAVVWDGRTYIKRVYKEKDGLRLESLNSKYRDLFAPFEEEPRIIGFVVGHFMPMEK